MYKHILISTDGSELAQKGADHGLSLAQVLACKVTVITVTTPYPLQSATTKESWFAVQKQRADDALARVNEAAEKVGVEVEPLVRTNHSAAEAIVDAAKQLECDLVVMASHGRRGISRILLGSQAAEVVSHSPTPVLVVR